MNKREWIKKLKSHNGEPILLSPADCNELVLRLNGSTKDRKRPEELVFGYNRRQLNVGAIGSVVFSFMENAEHIERLELELEEKSHPGYLKNALQAVPENNRANTERVGIDNLEYDLDYLKSRIKTLRPISTKKRSEAIRMAVEWYAFRGIDIDFKKIENELTYLMAVTGSKQLQLNEWREIKEKQKNKPF